MASQLSEDLMQALNCLPFHVLSDKLPQEVGHSPQNHLHLLAIEGIWAFYWCYLPGSFSCTGNVFCNIKNKYKALVERKDSC